MSRWITDTFTTASIGPASSLLINRTIPANDINLGKIKVVPATLGVTSQVFIYNSAAATPADIVYDTAAFPAILVDPLEDDGGGVTVERNEGFVVPYEDADSSLALHLQIFNNDVVAKTYTVTLIYELATAASQVVAVPGGLKATAFAVGLDITSSVTASLKDRKSVV